jgi:hypothetical protein
LPGSLRSWAWHCAISPAAAGTSRRTRRIAAIKGDGVLGGHRVVEHHGVEDPAYHEGTHLQTDRRHGGQPHDREASPVHRGRRAAGRGIANGECG